MFKYTLIVFLFASSQLFAETTFQVPVPLDKIAHLATFQISDFQISSTSNDIVLTYTLPQDLSGDQIIITQSLVSDVDGQKHFENDLGTTDCTGPLDKLECSVNFKSLPLNQSKTISYLFAKYGYNQETKNRVMVSQIFAKELFGYIRSNP